MPAVNSAIYTSKLKFGTRLPSTGPNAGVPVIQPSFTTLPSGQVVPLLSNATVSTTTPSTPSVPTTYPEIRSLTITDVTVPQIAYSFTAPLGGTPDSYSVVILNNTRGGRRDELLYPPATSGTYSIDDAYESVTIRVTANYVGGAFTSSPVEETLTTQP